MQAPCNPNNKKKPNHKNPQVVDACQLGPDLALLRYGELTPIGDKGVSLSGGQRARVALARAVYADAQVSESIVVIVKV